MLFSVNDNYFYSQIFQIILMTDQLSKNENKLVEISKRGFHLSYLLFEI